MWPRRNKGISKLKTDCGRCFGGGRASGHGRERGREGSNCETHTSERASERKEGRKEGRVNHEKLAFVWIPREGGREGVREEEAAAAGNISMISRRSMRRRTREGRSLCRRRRQTATRDRGGGRGDTCGGARRLPLLERERLLSQQAKRLMESLKNPFLIRDGGDFRCHVRVFVFSWRGRPL